MGKKSLLQSGTCQAGVNSCQVRVLSAPLPRARMAWHGMVEVCEGAPKMGPKWVAMPLVSTLLERGGQQAACHTLMCCYTG